METEGVDMQRVAGALRRIARGIDELADAVAGAPDAPEDERTAALLEEWGGRGLSREETSALFRRHGFAPQTAGGWARGDWIEVRSGLRYVSERSRRWLADRIGDTGTAARTDGADRTDRTGGEG